MKKLGYILGGFVVFIIILAIVLGQMAEAHDGPTQSCAFRNSSTEVRSVTFEYLDSTDGKKYQVLDLVLKPGEEVIKQLPAHDYHVEVWNAQDKRAWQILSYKMVLPDNKTNHMLKYLDMADSIAYVVVTLNFVYEGNSFAQAMSSAAGTDQSDMYLKKTYNGNTLFRLAENFQNVKMVDFYKGEKLPSKIGSREFIYGLIPVSKSLLGTDKLYDYIQGRIDKAM